MERLSVPRYKTKRQLQTSNNNSKKHSQLVRSQHSLVIPSSSISLQGQAAPQICCVVCLSTAGPSLAEVSESEVSVVSEHVQVKRCEYGP